MDNIVRLTHEAEFLLDIFRKGKAEIKSDDMELRCLLVEDKAPRGAMKGEDCVGFNPKSATVKKVNNRWKIVDGNHMMFDFGTNLGEAKQSLSIIKHHGFTRSCFVGRPGPSFTYLRK